MHLLYAVAAPATAQMEVDAEIVLAVDASRSMDLALAVSDRCHGLENIGEPVLDISAQFPTVAHTSGTDASARFRLLEHTTFPDCSPRRSWASTRQLAGPMLAEAP
jgi:hypothetical protein